MAVLLYEKHCACNFCTVKQFELHVLVWNSTSFPVSLNWIMHIKMTFQIKLAFVFNVWFIVGQLLAQHNNLKWRMGPANSSMFIFRQTALQESTDTQEVVHFQDRIHLKGPYVATALWVILTVMQSFFFFFGPADSGSAIIYCHPSDIVTSEKQHEVVPDQV